MDVFNGIIGLYPNGRFFQQAAVNKDFWAEDPRPLTDLLTEDRQWCDSQFLKMSKKLKSLLRHSNDEEIRSLRRNREHGDIVLIDLLRTGSCRRTS